MQKTLILIKPDGVQRGLIGQIVTRFERRGLKIVAMKLLQMDTALAHQHYAIHKDKAFFKNLVDFITSGPIVAIVIEGDNAVAIARNTMGKTNPAEASLGTIRGDFGVDIGRNLVHGSDSEENAKKEVGIFFNESEIMNYKREIDCWLTEA
ncbi:MAG: nucleoside-diphosphate kinase [Dehalococcoidia bacterium]|nr:nucleoside-diphosphate kinase [Dehalococcoidia bacterium]